jgi:pimeloyl-ACP methyl ester carboxylesterase
VEEDPSERGCAAARRTAHRGSTRSVWIPEAAAPHQRGGAGPPRAPAGGPPPGGVGPARDNAGRRTAASAVSRHLVAEFAQREIMPAGAAYMEGDKRSAVDQFSRAVTGGIDYPGLFERTLSEDWFERALEDSDTAFPIDSPAFGEWEFGPEQVRQIRSPVLLVLGEQTRQVWASIHPQMLEWLPNASEARIPGANHFMCLSHPEETADAIRSSIQAQSRSM